MAKLRVAHVINGMGFGGVPPLVQQLMTALPRERYELSLYCLKRHGDGSPERQARLTEFLDAGIPVRFPEEGDTALQVVTRISEWLDEDEIDVLHTHSYRPNLIARTAGVLAARPSLRIAAHYHNYYDDKWTAEHTLPLERRLARRSDLLIACSEAVRAHVADRVGVPPQAIEVILNGVNCERFGAPRAVAPLRSALGIPAGARVVASVGRISRQKASDDVVRAARAICDLRRDCVFVMAGAGDDSFAPSVHAMVEQLGLKDRVIFTGHLADIAPIYALADVVVMPSRWEGFGLVLVEAMASGTPLVATAVGPIPEVVGEDAALLIQADSPRAIANAVLALLDDPQRARAMGAQGRARARMFSWDRAGARLDALYAKLTQEPHA